MGRKPKQERESIAAGDVVETEGGHATVLASNSSTGESVPIAPDETCWKPGDPPAPPAVSKLPAEVATVAIAGIPLGIVPENGYRQRHVDLQLDARSAATLRGLLQGLEEQEAKLANGRDVKSAADAVRWLLDRVGDSLDAAAAAA